MDKTTFSGVVVDTKEFKAAVNAVAVLVDEGTIRLTGDGLRVRAMDPSQIAMVDLHMPRESFEGYAGNRDEIALGVDFSELNKIVKRAKLEDTIELSLDRRLNIMFKGTTTRKFSVPIVGVEGTATPKEPGVEFTAKLRVNANTLRDVLKDVELVSGHMSLGADKGFWVRADGDAGSFSVDFGEDNVLDLDVGEKAKSIFSLDYVRNMLDAADDRTVVELGMKTDTPLRMEYAVGGSRVVYHLAPRIEGRV